MKKEIIIKKEVEILFPRNLYKSPGEIQWGSKDSEKSYDTVLVNDEDEYNKEIKLGYIDSFHEALFGKKKQVAKKPEEDDF